MADQQGMAGQSTATPKAGSKTGQKVKKAHGTTDASGAADPNGTADGTMAGGQDTARYDRSGRRGAASLRGCAGPGAMRSPIRRAWHPARPEAPQQKGKMKHEATNNAADQAATAAAGCVAANAGGMQATETPASGAKVRRPEAPSAPDRPSRRPAPAAHQPRPATSSQSGRW